MKQSEYRFVVYRGGASGIDADICRSAFRNYWQPGVRNAYLGFRIAKELRNETA